jgi:putative heme-binding domain-containing protein
MAATLVGPVAGQTLEERLLAEPFSRLAQAARDQGDAVRGAMVFHHSSVTCVACHSVGDRPNAIGPDLTKLAGTTSDESLVESLLEPSKVIAPAYAMVSVQTSDGLIVSGVPLEDTAEKLVLRDASQPENLIVLLADDIAERQPAGKSLMPTGQVNLLKDRGQFLDLVRYLIELRDGGSPRARELAKSLESLVREFPDRPLPNRAVVQRGEVSVAGAEIYPRGVALGFADATVLFDADQLRTVALWHDGFLTSSPQNYFGVYLHSSGSAPQKFDAAANRLTVKLSGDDKWQAFETPLESDPNKGTRFDGYQIGRNSVRLHYRMRVGSHRIAVTEDVTAQSRPSWQGLSRQWQFAGLPVGSQVALSLPQGTEHWLANAEGKKVDAVAENVQSPLLGFKLGDQSWVARLQGDEGNRWRVDGQPEQARWSLVSQGADEKGVAKLRFDLWAHREKGTDVDAAQLAELVASPPAGFDDFDFAGKPSAPLPLMTDDDDAAEPAKPTRPGLTANENIDEFPTATGRFLRFVVMSTTDGSKPGIDELEVYGADPKLNLALAGKATASSVIQGYDIHQVAHLNDGKLGNQHSWISDEPNGGWAQIEFPQPVQMQRVVWARDRTGVCQDRTVHKYRIEVSDDGEQWVKVSDDSGREDFKSPGSGVVNRNASPGYEMENIPLPYPGCRPSDVAFTDDGSMYLLTMTEGQVWRTRTPTIDQPQRVRWQRYASGLYHPIGLAVVDNRLYVAQKPEITELVDRDGDGVVDQYRTVATGWGLSTGWHEYCFGLAVDRQKNLWFALNTGHFWPHPGIANPGRWRGSVMRVSTDTERLDEVAKGCRVPNGICMGPEGEMFVTDNQGDWIEACKLAHVVPGRFYGHPEYKEDALPSGQSPSGRSTIWLPYHRSRSSSGPSYDVTGGKFGPFVNQMFVGDVGYGANAGILRVALEKIDGELQGACLPFVDGQPLGCERMKFGPDGSLYIASLTSGLTRMNYVAQSVPLAIQAIRIRPGGKGFVVQLTKPLAADQVIEPKQFHVKRYHYLYTANYGSPQTDEAVVPVEGAEVSSDRTSITLSFPVETYPTGMVFQMNVGELRDESGEKLLHNEAWYTVHKVPQ